jgi:hypothetical protein
MIATNLKRKKQSAPTKNTSQLPSAGQLVHIIEVAFTKDRV